MVGWQAAEHAHVIVQNDAVSRLVLLLWSDVEQTMQYAAGALRGCAVFGTHIAVYFCPSPAGHCPHPASGTVAEGRRDILHPEGIAGLLHAMQAERCTKEAAWCLAVCVADGTLSLWLSLAETSHVEGEGGGRAELAAASAVEAGTLPVTLQCLEHANESAVQEALCVLLHRLVAFRTLPRCDGRAAHETLITAEFGRVGLQIRAQWHRRCRCRSSSGCIRWCGPSMPVC